MPKRTTADAMSRVEQAMLAGLEMFKVHGPNAKVDQPGKQPVVKGWPTISEEEALAHVARGGNLGGKLGNGVMLVDVDDPALLDSLDLPETWTVKTGRKNGGFHLLYSYPDGYQIKNVSNVGGIKGLDVKAEGGFTVLPGSQHVSGNNYKWVKSPADVSLARCPQWLLNEFESKPETGEAPAYLVNFLAGPDAVEGLAGLDRGEDFHTKEQAQEVFNQCVERLSCAEDGEGNSTANQSAFTMAGLYDKDGNPHYSDEEIRNALLEATSGWTWTKPAHRKALLKSIDGAIKAGRSKPLSAPLESTGKPKPSGKGKEVSSNDPLDMARFVKDSNFPTLRFWRDAFYKWVDGTYAELEAKAIEKAVYETLEGAFYTVKGGKGKAVKKPITPNRRNVGDVVHALPSLPGVFQPSSQETPFHMKEQNP